MIILDTNVISELMRPSPDPAVAEWIRTFTSGQIFTTAVTVAEINYGLEAMAKGRRRSRLTEAAGSLFATMSDRVIAFDRAAANLYGIIVSERARSGAPISGFDAQIAAVCRVHGATLATRNIRDFAELDLGLINPWG